MAGKEGKESKRPLIVTIYLALYNFGCAFGWGVVFYHAVKNILNHT